MATESKLKSFSCGNNNSSNCKLRLIHAEQTKTKDNCIRNTVYLMMLLRWIHLPETCFSVSWHKYKSHAHIADQKWKKKSLTDKKWPKPYFCSFPPLFLSHTWIEIIIIQASVFLSLQCVFDGLSLFFSSLSHGNGWIFEILLYNISDENMRNTSGPCRAHIGRIYKFHAHIFVALSNYGSTMCRGGGRWFFKGRQRNYNVAQDDDRALKTWLWVYIRPLPFKMACDDEIATTTVASSNYFQKWSLTSKPVQLECTAHAHASKRIPVLLVVVNIPKWNDYDYAVHAGAAAATSSSSTMYAC